MLPPAIQAFSNIPVRAAFQSKPLQIFLIVVVLALGIYLYGRKAGKEKASRPAPLPNNGQGIPVGWEPTKFTDNLHDVLSGIFTSAYEKEKAFVAANSLVNDQLVAIYNDFNHRYGGKSGTLTQWLIDEFNVAAGDSVRDALVARLRSLNCP